MMVLFGLASAPRQIDVRLPNMNNVSPLRQRGHVVHIRLIRPKPTATLRQAE